MAVTLYGCVPRDLAAQNLVITNARIITGAGAVIDRGSVVVRDGRIVSVAAGSRHCPGARYRCARYDRVARLHRCPSAHHERQRRPVAQGTICRPDAGVPRGRVHDADVRRRSVPGILELKRRVESGALKGPRIITSGRVDPDNFKTEDLARAQVRKYAQAGIEIIKARIDPEPTAEQKTILAIVVDEARKNKLDVMVHAVSVPAMLAALDAGATKLVHTPHGGWLSLDDARKVAAAGVETLSTIGFGVPVFGVFNKDNVPTFRDGSSWPDGILDGKGRGREAGEKAVNGRTLWDAGVTYGFGTDTGYHPREGLKHELRALSLMFST